MCPPPTRMQHDRVRAARAAGRAPGSLVPLARARRSRGRGSLFGASSGEPAPPSAARRRRTTLPCWIWRADEEQRRAPGAIQPTTASATHLQTRPGVIGAAARGAARRRQAGAAARAAPGSRGGRASPRAQGAGRRRPPRPLEQQPRAGAVLRVGGRLVGARRAARRVRVRHGLGYGGEHAAGVRDRRRPRGHEAPGRRRRRGPERPPPRPPRSSRAATGARVLDRIVVARCEEAPRRGGRRGRAPSGFGIPSLIDQRRGRRGRRPCTCRSPTCPFRDLMAERLGLPVFVDNDANVAMLAEQRCGAARGRPPRGAADARHGDRRRARRRRRASYRGAQGAARRARPHGRRPRRAAVPRATAPTAAAWRRWRRARALAREAARGGRGATATRRSGGALAGGPRDHGALVDRAGPRRRRRVARDVLRARSGAALGVGIVELRQHLQPRGRRRRRRRDRRGRPAARARARGRGRARAAAVAGPRADRPRPLRRGVRDARRGALLALGRRRR